MGIEIDIGIAITEDIVDSQPIITNDAPEVFPLGETIVTWTATDSSGNSASATQIITVVDTTAPAVEIPESLIFEALTKNDNLVEIPMIDANDNTQILSITNDAPVFFEFGTTIVTWTILDMFGNQSVIEQEIDIVDNTLPTITAPTNVQVEATSLENNIVEFGFADASDQVEVSIITNDAPTTFPLGETIVTWTATDKFGNTSSSLQTISVQTCGNDPLSYNLIVGSEEDDILIGTALSDLIFANGGDDIISGDKGNDCILAGDGDDIIFGNQGNDHISGQGGNDIIKGQSGEDFVFGGLGLDVIDGGDDIDTCKVIDEQSYDIVIKCELNE